jgi:hypothetical protein
VHVTGVEDLNIVKQKGTTCNVPSIDQSEKTGTHLNVYTAQLSRTESLRREVPVMVLLLGPYSKGKT